MLCVAVPFFLCRVDALGGADEKEVPENLIPYASENPTVLLLWWQRMFQLEASNSLLL